MIDTGAHRSVISNETLQKIEYTVGQPRKRNYIGATNHELQLNPNYVSFKIIIGGKKFPIVNALVENNKPDGSMLIGQSDLHNLDATLSEGDGKMAIGRKNRVVVQRYNQNELKSKRKPKINMVKKKEDEKDWKTQATIGDTCHMGGDTENWEKPIPEPSETCHGCPNCTTNENRIQNEDYAMIDDSKLALKVMCQKIQQKMHNTYTPELHGHRQSCPQTTVVCTLSADTPQTQTYYYFKNADTEQTQTFKYFKSADTQQTQAHISSD